MILKDKIAIITGAAQGIGKAIAVTLAKRGCKLAIIDKNEKVLIETSKEMTETEVIAFSIDVANLKEVEETVEKVNEKFGRIDILVNNAGITRDTLVLRMKEEDWDAVLNVNLKGTFNCSKAVTKYMVKQRNGKIINISSIIGIIGNAGQANYSASKAGVIGLTKSLAKELASRNINVNAVAPGFIKTAMTDILSQEVKDIMLKNIPLSRFGEPSDIAEAVLFLASDSSNYITGHVLEVTGGLG